MPTMHSSKPQLMLESFLFFLFCQQLFTSVCFCCFFFFITGKKGGGGRTGGREIENKPNSSLTSARISIQTRYAVFYMKNKRIVEMFPSCQMEIRGWIGEETTSLHSGSVWRWAQAGGLYFYGTPIARQSPLQTLFTAPLFLFFSF